MKRIAAIVLSLALVLTSFTQMMFSVSAEGTPTITCGSAECYAGEKVTVDITVANNPGIDYLSISTAFAKELGTPTFSNQKNILPDFTSGNQYLWTADENIATNGTLITLTFTVGEDVAPGDYAVNFIFRESYHDEDDVQFTVKSGAIKVKPVAVTGVSFSTTTVSVNIGSSATLTPVLAPANASNKKVTWSTSDATVVSVADGVVTGLKKGSATITAKTVDGNFEATCTVTVSCNHVWVEDAQAKFLVSEANCSKKAVYYKSCSVCGDKSEQTFEYGEKNAAKHTGNTNKLNEKKATCYETGYTGDIYCTDCKALISSGSIIKMDEHNVDTAWTTDGTYHWHKCLNAGCTAQLDKAVHSGGIATCAAKAVCTVCKTSYGEKNPANHTGNNETRNDKKATCCETGFTGDTYCKDCNTKIASGAIINSTGIHVDTDGKWETDGTNHWHTCYFGTKFDVAAHTGGTATCAAKAVCTVCSSAYGEKNAHNHIGETELRNVKKETCCETGFTGDTYCKDCNTKIASGAIINSTGIHVDTDGKWETDATNHWHTCYFGTKFDVAAHTGGTATCAAKAVCTVCSSAYGEKNPTNHTGNNETRNDKKATCCETGFTGDTYCKDCNTKIASGAIINSTGIHVDTDGKWETDGTNHWHTCYFGTKFDTAAHTGGTATCAAKAVCTVCSSAYGEKNPTNHTGNNETRNDKKATCCETGFTGDTYCKDCNTKIASGAIINSTGIHVDADGKWETDGTNHWHTCYFGTKFDTGAHTGGTATCAAKAVCTVCSSAYGEKNPANHSGNTGYINEIEPTCCEEGYSGDIICSDCRKVLSSGSILEPTGDHVDYDDLWDYDDEFHWYVCYFGTTFNLVSHSGGKATCSEKAICEVCGGTYGEVDTTNHVGETEVKNAKEAKCNEEGYTGDTFCKTCGLKIAEGKAIKKLSHNITGWTVTKEASTTECGEKTGKCSYCGEEFKTETAKLSSKPIEEKNIKYEGMTTAPQLAPSEGTVLPENAVFQAEKKEVEKLTEEEKVEVEKAVKEIESNAISYLGKHKGAEKVDVICVFSFDIMLQNTDEESGDSLGEEEYHFDGSVKVTVEMPEAIKNAKNPVIIHLKDDGTCEPVAFTINDDGTISFTVTGFSSFIIVDVETVDLPVTVVAGDVNGDEKVDIMDLIRLQKYISGSEVEVNMDNADANESGSVDLFDLIRLKKMISGLV